jgi:hypothetical protein
MIYKLTEEQIKEYQTQTLRVLGYKLFMFFVLGALAVYPMYLAGGGLDSLCLLWTMLGLVYVFSSGMDYKTRRENQITQLAVNPESLELTAPKVTEAIPYRFIQKLRIYTDPEGNVELICLRALESLNLKPSASPYLLFEGYESMTQLAGELEERVSNLGVVIRIQNPPDLNF